MIYLDNSATTKPDESVVHSFMQVSTNYYGNPSSIHELGATVEKLHDEARRQAAKMLEVSHGEIIFTSGGTEGNNLAIKGIALEHQNRGSHIITSAIEHVSVFETCKSLEQLGFTVTFLPVDPSGKVDLDSLENAITDETILISVMHVNNEIGTIQPLEEIGLIVKKYPKIFFHVDAVQGLGKVPLKLKEWNIDLCTFSGHKIHGLKGTGLLYVKNGTSLYPLFHGGNQEFSTRSGTENVAGNVSFVRALRLIKEQEANNVAHLIKLRTILEEKLTTMDGVVMNSPKGGAPHIINVSIPGLKPETVIHALYDHGVVVSTQSACSSKQFESSRILEACGRNDAVARSGIRISLSYTNTKEEIESFCSIFSQTIHQLKEALR